MKRLVWLSLPLVFSLGCHRNLLPSHCCGGAVVAPSNRRFPNEQSQVNFVSPAEMNVGWETAMEGARGFMPAQLSVPGRFNFRQGAIYRMKLTDVPGYDRRQFYPTLEVAPSSPRTDAFLTHNAIPIEFTDEDFDQVDAGNFVTKVIYLPDPQYQELAIAGVETLVSTRLDPGVDPIAEADRRGTILAIVRLGGIDLEMAQPAVDGASIMSGPSVASAEAAMNAGTTDGHSGRAVVVRR